MSGESGYGRKLAKLETLRNELLTELARHGRQMLNRKPEDGGWSPGQVLAHVIEAERMSLAYVRKKTQAPESIRQRSLRHWFNGVVLSTAMRTPLKFQVPPTVGEPPDNVVLEELQRDWQEVREGWRELLNSFPPQLHNKTVYRHPVAGPLSMDQSLAFLVRHLERHARQIRRSLG